MIFLSVCDTWKGIESDSLPSLFVFYYWTPQKKTKETFRESTPKKWLKLKSDTSILWLTRVLKKWRKNIEFPNEFTLLRESWCHGFTVLASIGGKIGLLTRAHCLHILHTAGVSPNCGRSKVKCSYRQTLAWPKSYSTEAQWKILDSILSWNLRSNLHLPPEKDELYNRYYIYITDNLILYH